MTTVIIEVSKVLGCAVGLFISSVLLFAGVISLVVVISN